MAQVRLSLVVNGRKQLVQASADTPLLWVLRDELGLTGTKFGCGEAYCGACTVHLDGKAVRACQTPLSEAAGHAVTTIEGLAASWVSGGTAPAPPSEARRGPTPTHPLQQAWIAEEVPQCGYCQSGQIMAAAALLAAHPNPTDADIDAAMSEILCRCGTYNRIRRAIRRAAGVAP